jgi:hypothetical protein
MTCLLWQADFAARRLTWAWKQFRELGRRRPDTSRTSPNNKASFGEE